MKGMLGAGLFSFHNERNPMKYLKNKWTLVLLLALAGLISGGAYSDQITQAVLLLIGQ